MLMSGVIGYELSVGGAPCGRKPGGLFDEVEAKKDKICSGNETVEKLQKSQAAPDPPSLA